MRKYFWMAAALALHANIAAQVFKWTDKDGAVHYGDVVPESYKKSARPVSVSNDVPTEAQVQDAEKARARLRAAAKGAVAPSAPSPRAATPPASLSASSPIDAQRLSCAEQWKRFEASHACFEPYRMGNGVLRPEAFDHCQEVRPPENCKDTRSFKW